MNGKGIGTWITIFLLGGCMWLLADIYQEMKLQRTPKRDQLGLLRNKPHQ